MVARWMPRWPKHSTPNILLAAPPTKRCSLPVAKAWPKAGCVRTRIFQAAEERLWLEQLLHPLIREEVRNTLEEARSPYAILMAPLLVESAPLRQMTRRILVVDVPPQLQIARTTQRDRVPEEQVRAIIQAQASREERLRHAHDVLSNDRDLTWLQQEVERLHAFYLSLKGDRP